MRLIFANRYFWPDESATAQLLGDLAFALARDAPHCEVYVVTSRQGYEAAGQRLPAREEVGGVRIVRVWSSRFGRHALIGRAIDYATFCASAAWALLRLARRGDVIVAKTDPPLLSVVAGPVARARGARLVNWLQDIFPEVATKLGTGGWALRVLAVPMARLRNLSLRGAAANVVLGEHMAQQVRNLNVAPERIVTIANWADGQVVSPVARTANRLRQAWGLEGKFVVAYSGNLGRAHEIGTVLDAIAQVERDDEEHYIAWLFIGGGALVPELKRQVAARRLRSALFHPYQPRQLLAESLGIADAHLVSLRADLEGLIVPSKIYGVLAAGRPAICIGDPDGEVARLLARAGCGACVVQGDSLALADCVRDWAADPATVHAMGLRARAVFEARYDRPVAVARWARLLRNVADGAPAGAGLGADAAAATRPSAVR